MNTHFTLGRRRVRHAGTFALFFFLLLCMAMPTTAAGAALPYDERANARIDIEDAMRSARNSGKNMLVVYGANWCADCLRLDSRIHDDNGLLGDRRYVIVKIDVGRFDKNVDLAQLHGNPISKGIPGAAVVSPEGQTLYSGPLINLLEPYQSAKRLLRYTGGTLGVLLAAAIILVLMRRARLGGRPSKPASQTGMQS